MPGERPFPEVVKEISKLESARIISETLGLHRKLQCEYLQNLDTAKKFNLQDQFLRSAVFLKEVGFFAEIEFSHGPKLINDAKIPKVEGESDYVLSLAWDTEDIEEKRYKIEVKVTNEAIIIGGDKEPVSIRRLNVKDVSGDDLNEALTEVFKHQVEDSAEEFGIENQDFEG